MALHSNRLAEDSRRLLPALKLLHGLKPRAKDSCRACGLRPSGWRVFAYALLHSPVPASAEHGRLGKWSSSARSRAYVNAACHQIMRSDSYINVSEYLSPAQHRADISSAGPSQNRIRSLMQGACRQSKGCSGTPHKHFYS